MKKIIQCLITFALFLAIVMLSSVGLRETLSEYVAPKTSFAIVTEAKSQVTPNESPEFITGPVAADVGELCVFKLNSETRADWVVVRQIDKDSPPQFYIDTSGSALAFSSSIPAKYTIVAAIIEEGYSPKKPRILQHVCDYGMTPQPKPEPTPTPKPEPEPKTLTEWVRQNIPEQGKNQSVALASCYESTALGIEKGLIKTPDAAFSRIRTCSQTKIKIDVWKDFLDKLSEKINERFFGNRDIKELGAIYKEISAGLKPVAEPEIPAPDVPKVKNNPIPQTRVISPVQQTNCATGTCPVQPRYYRNR